MEKKNYLQVYLEECEYRMKKTKMTNFIKVELDSESGSESDTELEAKLESDSEYVILLSIMFTNVLTIHG